MIKGVSYRGAPLYLHDSRPVTVTCHSLLLSHVHTHMQAPVLAQVEKVHQV